MKKLLILLLVFNSFAAFAQDLTGTWEGIFFNEWPNGKSWQFYIRFHLKQQGSAVWGVCEALSQRGGEKTFDIKNAKLSCMYPVSGELPHNSDTNKILQLFRGNITESVIPIAVCESIFHFDFDYKILKKTEYMTGKWYSIYPWVPGNDASRGMIAVTRASYTSPDFVDAYFPKLDKMLMKSFKKDSAYLVKEGVYDKIFNNETLAMPIFDSLVTQRESVAVKQVEAVSNRMDLVQKIIDIDSSFIKIDLYDNGIVDDDTVSVYLNGSKIVSSRRLAAVPLHMELELDDKEDNELKLFAENLGEIPPNTALMIVTVNGKRIELNLSASLSNNAVVVFRKKKALP